MNTKEPEPMRSQELLDRVEVKLKDSLAHAKSVGWVINRFTMMDANTKTCCLLGAHLLHIHSQWHIYDHDYLTSKSNLFIARNSLGCTHLMIHFLILGFSGPKRNLNYRGALGYSYYKYFFGPTKDPQVEEENKAWYDLGVRLSVSYDV